MLQIRVKCPSLLHVDDWFIGVPLFVRMERFEFELVHNIELHINGAIFPQDKFTYDSERADIPLRSIDYEPSIVSGCNSTSEISDLSTSDGELSPVVKRDSIVNRYAVQKSICINGRFQNPFNTWRPPTFTNILKFGLTKDKSNIPTKQVLFEF